MLRILIELKIIIKYHKIRYELGFNINTENGY